MPQYHASIMLQSEDLTAVAAVITTRLPTPARSCAAPTACGSWCASSELNRALTTYSRHAMVHCQGTAGTSGFSAGTRMLADALQSFCAEFHDVAQEYASFANELPMKEACVLKRSPLVR